MSQSSPPVRNATCLRTFSFLEFIYVFREILSTSVFFAARFTSRQPKTPVRNPTNLRTFCFEDYHYAFQETLLSRDSRSLNLCVLFKFIFLLIPLIHSAPFLRFSHILLYTNFFWCNITTRNIFLIPDDPVARNLIIIFHFSSQRPHLNFFFFSNVYSFDTMEFSKKHKC